MQIRVMKFSAISQFFILCKSRSCFWCIEDFQLAGKRVLRSLNTFSCAHNGDFSISIQPLTEKELICYILCVLSYVCLKLKQNKTSTLLKNIIFQCILLLQFSHVCEYLSRSKRTEHARLSLLKELTSTCLRS